MRADQPNSKRSKSPSRSFFQSAPAHVMGPRLMVGLSTFSLVVVGLVMVYSSSSIAAFVEAGDSSGEAIRQCLFVVIGLVVAFAVAVLVKNDFLRGTGGTIFWAICVILLVVTSVLGTVGLGARRWLIIGPISIQISEFAKIAFIIMAARIAQDYREGLLDLMGALKQAIMYLIVPIGFLFISQSDLGTTLICCVSLIVVMWLSGVSNRTLVVILGVGLVLGLVAIMVSSYRSDRLSSFLDPWADEQGTGYQLVHSFKALAAGGLFGVGIGNSYEKLQYLPEAETDFIFAIIGEELGLVGALCVIGAFLVFLRGGFLIASQSRSMFGGLVAAGLTTMVVFQAFLNIACVVGLFPTTGKPLPFISSGGSSMISSLMLVGIILSISFDSHNEDQYRQRRESLHVVSTYSQPQRRASATRRINEVPHRGGEALRARSMFTLGRSAEHTSTSLRGSFQVVGGSRGRNNPSYIGQSRLSRTSRR